MVYADDINMLGDKNKYCKGKQRSYIIG